MKTVLEALELHDLETATTLLIEMAGGPSGRLSQDETERLGSKEILKRVAAILEYRADELSKDELVETGLDYLKRLDPCCVRSVCRLYGDISNDAVRRVFRRYLSQQASWDAELIGELTTHSRRTIVKEAVGILAMGGKGSRAWRMVRKYSEDTTNLPRAAYSTLFINRIERRKPLIRLFVAVEEDASVTTRIGAAKTLAKNDSDAHMFVPMADLISGEAFAMREPREIEAVLRAFVVLGGPKRAIPFLHDLTQAPMRLVVGRTRTEKLKLLARQALDRARGEA